MILFLHAMNPQIISMTCPNLSSIWEGQMIWRAGTFENFGIVCLSLWHVVELPFFTFCLRFWWNSWTRAYTESPLAFLPISTSITPHALVYIYTTSSMGGALPVVKRGSSWNWRLLGEKIERPCKLYIELLFCLQRFIAFLKVVVGFLTNQRIFFYT